jgi:hypothetical protein
MPKLDILEPRKTSYQPLGLIPHDESSNSGNLAVLENIFQRQYKLSDQAFKNNLYLIYGDQKTTQRIRTIKRHRLDSTRPYDSLKWALPVPALFHLKMNLLYMISRCHFGGQDHDYSTLHYAMNFWGRKKISKAKADFFTLEELVIHSFQSRIVALMWVRLRHTGLGMGVQDIEAVLRTLDPEGFYTLIERVRIQCSFTANPDLKNLNDEEVRSHYLSIRHAQTYLLLKYAVKHADIGLLRRAIDRCCIYFHGSGQSKYAYEMLYLQRILLASEPRLCRAILSNSLVNLQGSPNSWFETDRLLEFHNGDLKLLFRAKRGSTLDLETLLDTYSLSSTYFKHLHNKIERLFGMRSNSEHTSKSAETDIRLMAERLLQSIVYSEGRTVKYPAIDALKKGALRLGGNVLAKFHASECFGDDNMEYTGLKGFLDEEIGPDEEFNNFFSNAERN